MSRRRQHSPLHVSLGIMHCHQLKVTQVLRPDLVICARSCLPCAKLSIMSCFDCCEVYALEVHKTCHKLHLGSQACGLAKSCVLLRLQCSCSINTSFSLNVIRYLSGSMPIFCAQAAEPVHLVAEHLLSSPGSAQLLSGLETWSCRSVFFFTSCTSFFLSPAFTL